jgi:hypothetical protein
MARKHIILVHGRDIKPAVSEMEKLARRALQEGFRRSGSAVPLSGAGAVKFSLVYFGDITNDIQAKASKVDKAKLTARDPDFGNAACFPIEPLKAGFDTTGAVKKFDEPAYASIISKADDLRLLDEAADFASLIGQLFTFGILNTVAINMATADLGAYLTEHKTGSAIRDRLQNVLRPALEAGDDICLVTHSLGCMVAYDVFWKFSMTSEYEKFRALGKKVSLWLTIGCPLGEAGVVRNLLDGRYGDSEKYPRRQFARWENVYAKDDYIAHVERMAPVYKPMVKRDYADSIKDRQIYNCWSYIHSMTGRLVSNPHDLYGYLMHQDVGKMINAWAV